MTKSKGIVLFIAICMIIITSCGSKLDTDKEKYSYALGNQVGASMKKDGIDIDRKAFQLGFKEGLAGNSNSLSEKDMIDGLKAYTKLVQEKKEQAR